MLPTSILRTWITGLLALAILGAAGYLIYDWYYYDQDDQEYLYWASGLVAFASLGRLLVTPLLGKGEAARQPAELRGTSETIIRPDGTQLQVQSSGPADAQPIVLVHGWGLDASAWQYLLTDLGEQFRLITWDLRGIGRSSQPKNRDYSLEAMAADLEAVTAKAQRPAILLGHSIGGMIIQTFCRLYPQHLGSRVSGLVLVDTTYLNPVNTAALRSLWRPLQKPVIQPLLHLTIWLSPLVWLMNLLSYQNGSSHVTSRITSFAGAQTRRQLDLAVRLGSFASPAVLARGMLAMLRLDEQRTLGSISVPVLVVSGENDRLTQPDAAQHISRAIPGARLEMLKPCGHESVLEQHQALAQLVTRFGAEHSQPANKKSPVGTSSAVAR